MLKLTIFLFYFLVAVDSDHRIALLEDLENAINRPRLDAQNEGDISEVNKAIEDRGFNNDDVKYDFVEALLSVPGIFTAGDARRWATLNAVYQIACYQGETSNLFTESLWVYGKYYGYGCYCGAGDYYGNYRDATDLCCKHHDECYTKVINKYKISVGCPTYVTPYSVSCCKDHRITKCTDSGPSVGRALCECDQAMAKCYAQPNARNTYNKAFMNDRSKCDDTSTKTRGYQDIIASCKDIFNSPLKFPITYGSQGQCPK